MSNFRTSARPAVLLLLAAAQTSLVRGEAPRPRVTIRGTGTNVAIERTTTSEPRKRSFVATSPVLEDAIRMKTRGASDAVVIAYLRAHQGDLPAVVDAEDVRQLRRAGASRSVIAFLASASAVDIGPTGEGREADAMPAPTSEPDSGYFSGYPYPIGGYSAPYPGYGAGFPKRFAPHGRFALHHPIVVRDEPRVILSQRPSANHAAIVGRPRRVRE